MGQFSSSLRNHKAEEASFEKIQKNKPKDEIVVQQQAAAQPAAKKARPDDHISRYAIDLNQQGILPDSFLVHEAPSSQYVDEDGDVANEFYEEMLSEDKKRRLCRLMRNIRPKGKERYAIPRLNADVPVVMWEMKDQ